MKILRIGYTTLVLPEDKLDQALELLKDLRQIEYAFDPISQKMVYYSTDPQNEPKIETISISPEDIYPSFFDLPFMKEDVS